MSSVTGPDGRVIGYAHDAAGRLAAMSTPGVDPLTYTYDPDGRLLGEALPGGGSRSWTWTDGRLSGFAQQVDEVSSTATLAYDLAGRLVEATVDGVTTSYGYDPAGQLLAATTAGGQARTWAYDPSGQRTASSVDGLSTSYTHDPAGRLTGTTGPAGTVAFGYDAAGRRVSESGPTGDVDYDYDARGRLSSVTVDDVVSVTEVARGWDAEDRLASLAVSVDGAAPSVTSLWWDPLEMVPQVARIRQGGGGPVDLVYGLGRVYAVDGAGSAAVFATDHLGSVVATSATAGLVLAEEYTPFGQPHGPPPGSGAVGFGYRGELHVGDLLHLRARDYQPATGVFLAPDPLDGVPGLPTVTNRYHYANSDPLGHVDPLGLRPWNDRDMRGGLFFGVGAYGGFLFDGSRDTVAARRYWAAHFGISEVTLAVTVEHDSGWIRGLGWPWRMLDAWRRSSSAGLGSIQHATAMERMRERFLIEPHSVGAVRHSLAFNDDFNIAVTAAHLRVLQDIYDLTGRGAFIAYAFSEKTILELRDSQFEFERLTTEQRYGRTCFSVQCVALESSLARNLRSRQRRWDELAGVYASLEER